ncbi:hypothetical protein ACHAP5_005153 [Fusarium lateritium]
MIVRRSARDILSKDQSNYSLHRLGRMLEYILVCFLNRKQDNMQHLIHNRHYVAVCHELTEPFEKPPFRRDDVGTWKTDGVIALSTEPTKLHDLLDKGSVPLPFRDRDAHSSIMDV